MLAERSGNYGAGPASTTKRALVNPRVLCLECSGDLLALFRTLASTTYRSDTNKKQPIQVMAAAGYTEATATAGSSLERSYSKNMVWLITQKTKTPMSTTAYPHDYIRICTYVRSGGAGVMVSPSMRCNGSFDEMSLTCMPDKRYRPPLKEDAHNLLSEDIWARQVTKVVPGTCERSITARDNPLHSTHSRIQAHTAFSYSGINPSSVLILLRV